MRLQIEVTEEQERQMLDTMARAGISTKKDLINNALTLFVWALDEVSAGNSIASVNEDEKRYRELQMPPLNYARMRSPRRVAAMG